MRVFIACILAFIFATSSLQAKDDVIVVGVDPSLYAIALQGVKGWNDYGLNFVVQATGCGTGDVTFCYSDDPWSFGLGTSQIAWYPIGGNVIYVSTVSLYPFLPTTVCHELGHWLGLNYHRTDYLSCMSDRGQTSESPDIIDIENLGWT